MNTILDPLPYISGPGSRHATADKVNGMEPQLRPRDAVIKSSSALRRLLATGAPGVRTLLAMVESHREYRPSNSDIDVAAQIVEAVGPIRRSHLSISPSKDVTLFWSEPDLRARVINGRVFVNDQNFDNAGDASDLIVAILGAADNQRRALDAVLDGAVLALHKHLFDSGVSNGLDMDVLTAAVGEQFGYPAAKDFAAYAAGRTDNEFAD